ncbi:MAG: tyrosine-type recombinase/integrase [Deltaproteobacteria bacterium]|nr:tyrosine-type recombinase/integrase [Deltaproteobacteria bacterium]
MGAESVQTRSGVRWRFRRTVGGRRLRSRAIYLTKREAQSAEGRAVAHYEATGEVIAEWQQSHQEDEPCESVSTLFARWIKWLSLHRSPRHATDMQGLLGRALAQAPEFADLPADRLTTANVEAWAERWAKDLTGRGRTRHEVNKFLRYAQTAFNAPWGSRRAEREYSRNPFAHVDRFSVQRTAKYVPTAAEVAAVRLAAEGEFRLYLELLLETGARPSEGLNLAWAEVRHRADPPSVVLYTQKSRGGNRVPRRLGVSPELAERFTAWRRAQGPGATYVFRQAEQDAGHHLIWTRKQHLAACKQAGVGYYPVGCYRHYYASRLAHEGVPLTTIQAKLGHSQATTTNNYLQELLGV